MPKESSEMPRIWKVRAWSDGPGMFRYSVTPGITAEERRQLEPWNYPQEETPEYSRRTPPRPGAERVRER